MALQRGARRTFEEKEWIIDFIKLAQSSGVKTSIACMCAGISIKSFYRWKNHSKDDKRNGPHRIQHKFSETQEKEFISVICSSEYQDYPISQLIPKLLDKGIYLCSESTMRRILKKHNLNTPRVKTKSPQNRSKPILISNAPNQVWSWDITYLRTNIKGKFFYLYLALDIFSRFIVAGKIFENESGDNASEFIHNATLKEGVVKKDITLHSDNGSPMKSATLRIMLENLGVLPSFSRPRVSNDNPFSESLFKTLKYTSTFPLKDGFKTIEEASEWVKGFIQWYNFKHQHSGIKYCTPFQRHNLLDAEILKKRDATMQKAMEKNPRRWINKKTKNYDYISEVSINKENLINEVA